MKLTTTASVVLLFSFLVPAIATAQGPVIPVAWSGVWSDTGTERDCGTGVLLDSWIADLDTICPGPVLEEDPSGNPIPCTGTVTDTEVDITCTSTAEVLPGCTASVTVTTSAVRDGDSYSQNSQISITFTENTPGDCMGAANQCANGQSTATRISTDISSCPSTPVEAVTWGLLKTRHE